MLTASSLAFDSEANRRTLQGAGSHFIFGEKMRHGNKQAEEALNPLYSCRR